MQILETILTYVGISYTQSNSDILDSINISLIELNIKRNPPKLGGPQRDL